jgi:hypothetical protein
MGVLVIGAAVFAVLLGAGLWVAKAPQGPRVVLGIALDVLSGAFLMQPTRARATPRRTHPRRAAGKSRDVATPVVTGVDVRPRRPVPGEASAVRSRPGQATAGR